MEGYRVGTKKDTGGDTGDTGKTGTGMSGIFRAASRDAEGHLGQDTGTFRCKTRRRAGKISGDKERHYGTY